MENSEETSEQRRRSRLQHMRDWWSKNFGRAEFALVLLLTAILTATDSLDSARPLASFLDGSRGTVYGVLTSLWGALLGFSITAVSIVFALSDNDRLTLIRQSEAYSQLWDIFISAIRALGAATAAALIALLLDRDYPHESVRLWMYLCTFTSMLAVMRLWRVVWVLEKLIRIMAAPSKARKGNES